MPRFLAFDIGTSAGRAILGTLHEDKLTLEIVHRFPNRAVPVRGTLYWDILHLWHGMLDGLQNWIRSSDLHLDGIGLDTWAVDFALLDESGRLLDNPVHNRDTRTDGMMERVFQMVSRQEIYAQTGIQFMQINTLYQLYALVVVDAPVLRYAATFLTVADLLNFWLTGRKVVEFTSATCTQFYNPNAGNWTHDLLKRLAIPTHMLPQVVPPGTVLGSLNAQLSDMSAIPAVPIIAVATHDTASAVAAVPAETDRFAYISSGTWSLVGAEVQSPVITPESLKYNFTNEGGVGGTFCLLKNVLGMWLVQACQDTRAISGERFTDGDLVEMAAAAPPFGPFIDPHPNSPDFRTVGNMPARIRDFCVRTGQSVPIDKGAVLRCIFESLALKYRQVLVQLEEVLGYSIDVIHIVGGGSRNELLCQMTADATNRSVIAGPAEATAMGNLAVQAVATGHLASREEARALIRCSSHLKRYDPISTQGWDHAYQRFIDIV